MSPSPTSEPYRGFGAKRQIAQHAQTNIGPCRRCGTPVWRRDTDPIKDELPVHKFCQEREANGE